MEVNKEEIAKRIKILRITHGETMAQFGKRFDTSDSIVSRWEKGVSIPNAKRLKEISVDFEINMNWLLYGEGEKHGRSPMDKT
ncbi:helix-turn-helix domain-containing protein [Staphylococcus caeli]|uniref:helix-turn-helix domain-containing protein n=1 Tax=Staphylococcus caeli TaxID=2201815 RepID=UPI003F562546